MRTAVLALAPTLAVPATAGATFRDFRSRRSGITCRSLRSGHGFRVNVEKRELF